MGTTGAVTVTDIRKTSPTVYKAINGIGKADASRSAESVRLGAALNTETERLGRATVSALVARIVEDYADRKDGRAAVRPLGLSAPRVSQFRTVARKWLTVVSVDEIADTGVTVDNLYATRDEASRDTWEKLVGGWSPDSARKGSQARPPSDRTIINVPKALADRLRAAAESAGVTVDEWITTALDTLVGAEDDDDETDPAEVLAQYHTRGGWYRLPGHDRSMRRDAALAALTA